jgi:hypothetical protein
MAMFSHSDFVEELMESKYVLKTRINNQEIPDCSKNAFLRRACEYISANTFASYLIVGDFGINEFKDQIIELQKKAWDKCLLLPFHETSAELSDAIKVMQL